jgi:bifunctional DNA-binding transcriptional regulator/antitoxin component of YhaV-PrlF toxin-antitoxin module
MTTVITLTAKNQLTLPVKLVSFLGLNKGSKLWTRIEEKTIILEKVEDTWDDLQGVLADTPMAKKYTVEQVIGIARSREAKRLVKKYAK